MKLNLRLLAPVVFEQLELADSEEVFDVVSDAKFDFPLINEQDDDEPGEILLKYKSSVQAQEYFYPKAVLPKSGNFRIPLLRLLQPASDEVSIDFDKVRKIYGLKVFGASKKQVYEANFVSCLVPMDFPVEVSNFDSHICKNLNQIARKQLEQIVKLAFLLNIDYADRLSGFVKYLLESMPPQEEGCLLHWTFAGLEKLLQIELDFDSVLFLAYDYTSDVGYEVMPLNWAVLWQKD